MIREATEQDAEAITAIFNYYIRDTVITFEEDEINTGHFIERFNKVKRSGFSWLVAVDDGDVIGFAYSSKWIERAAYRNTAEVSVYLAHTVTSKGWGTKLYNALFSTLREKSIHIALGGITLPNPASVALHEKFGMEKVAHFKQVGYKFGEWLDVGYWQVQLNAHP
ncbi:MAG: GNAT family N-acetyltransferase [Betaproteobacteria bacterium]|nr:GNAT family N-acetyltransferase [Betaproteobacteria bacterium]